MADRIRDEPLKPELSWGNSEWRGIQDNLPQWVFSTTAKACKFSSWTCEGFKDYIVVVMSNGRPLGEFEQVVLLAILRLDDAAYGVSIRKEIAACTRRTVAPGALYTTLERLERKKLVAARSGDPTPERGGRAKRFYSVTKLGHTSLVQAQSGFRELMQGLSLLGETNE